MSEGYYRKFRDKTKSPKNKDKIFFWGKKGQPNT